MKMKKYGFITTVVFFILGLIFYIAANNNYHYYDFFLLFISLSTLGFIFFLTGCITAELEKIRHLLEDKKDKEDINK